MDAPLGWVFVGFQRRALPVKGIATGKLTHFASLGSALAVRTQRVAQN